METSPSKAFAKSAAVAAEVVVGVRMGKVSRLEVEPKGVPVRVEGGMVPPPYIIVAEVVIGGSRQVSWEALELNTGQGTPHTVTLVVPVLVGKVAAVVEVEVVVVVVVEKPEPVMVRGIPPPHTPLLAHYYYY